MEVNLNAYDDFQKHFRALEPQERIALGNFLRSLQKLGPYSPEIQKKCEMEADERYAYEFSPKRTVFWKVVEYRRKNAVTPSDDDEIFVDITAIGRLR